MFGARGGLALEKGEPAESGVFVGYKSTGNVLHYLPFFEGVEDDAARYRRPGDEERCREVVFGEKDIERTYRWATDTFKAPGIVLEIATPFFPIPNPDAASEEELRFACCPAAFLRLEILNESDEEHEAFFALENPAKMEFAARHVAGSGEEGVYLAEQATFNRPMYYWYTSHFAGLHEVFAYAMDNRLRYLAEAYARDAELDDSGLSEAKRFLVAHATRSYYGSTE